MNKQGGIGFMNFNPLRWNVLHLMLAVAFCAVLFALWKIWPGLAVIAAGAVIGFTVDKHYEGPGLGGSMLGGGCGSVAFGGISWARLMIGGPALPFSSGLDFVPTLLYGAGFAFMIGVVSGAVVYALMLPTMRGIAWLARKPGKRNLRIWNRDRY